MAFDGHGTGCTARAADGVRPPLDPAELRELTDALMSEIALLSGQEYVDHYANRSRDS